MIQIVRTGDTQAVIELVKGGAFEWTNCSTTTPADPVVAIDRWMRQRGEVYGVARAPIAPRAVEDDYWTIFRDKAGDSGTILRQRDGRIVGVRDGCGARPETMVEYDGRFLGWVQPPSGPHRMAPPLVDGKSGIESVDRIVGMIHDGDHEALRPLTNFTEYVCDPIPKSPIYYLCPPGEPGFVFRGIPAAIGCHGGFVDFERYIQEIRSREGGFVRVVRGGPYSRITIARGVEFVVIYSNGEALHIRGGRLVSVATRGGCGGEPLIGVVAGSITP